MIPAIAILHSMLVGLGSLAITTIIFDYEKFTTLSFYRILWTIYTALWASVVWLYVCFMVASIGAGIFGNNFVMDWDQRSLDFASVVYTMEMIGMMLTCLVTIMDHFEQTRTCS